MRKINLSRDFLNDLYTNNGMTLQEIADELGVSRQTVSNKLKEYGITIRNSQHIRDNKPPQKKIFRKIPDYRNKEKFEKAYNELKSIDLVAEYFHISQDTAFEWKKRHKIETIKEFSQRGRVKMNSGKPYTNKEWLETMYEQYSYEDLGKMLNCSPTTLSKWGQRFNIQTRTHSEQWDIKSKNGARVTKANDFDLQAYKKAYMFGNVNLSKNLKTFILALYGKCEACGYNEVLDLHHIDENPRNNAPDNHGILCPNCHSKIHRLGIPFSELVATHIPWDTLIDNYQESK